MCEAIYTSIFYDVCFSCRKSIWSYISYMYKHITCAIITQVKYCHKWLDPCHRQFGFVWTTRNLFVLATLQTADLTNKPLVFAGEIREGPSHTPNNDLDLTCNSDEPPFENGEFSEVQHRTAVLGALFYVYALKIRFMSGTGNAQLLPLLVRQCFFLFVSTLCECLFVVVGVCIIAPGRKHVVALVDTF